MNGKFFDIKTDPRTALESWERWLNYMQSKMLTISPKKRIKVEFL